MPTAVVAASRPPLAARRRVPPTSPSPLAPRPAHAARSTLHVAPHTLRTTLARSAAAPPEPAPPATTPTPLSPLDDLAAGAARKYIMVSGKGGVGKTSLSASLAVALAAEGHATLVVSTDPAHSLSDSLDCDVAGGTPVPVQGTDLPLWGLEVDPDAALAEWKASAGGDGGAGASVRDFLGGVGLGRLADALADLKLGDLLNTPPPGLDEAVAIAKVLEIAEDEKYARFTRVVIDTAPTGHTLRLLGVPDFVDAALGKLVRLRTKLGAAGGALRALFGAGEKQDAAVAQLEKLRAAVLRVRALFRDASTTEFVIATIPTQLAVAESKRLLTALRADGVPCKRVVVNQVLGPGDGAAFVSARARDQTRALALLDADPRIAALPHGRAPLLDLEVRGVPALRYFGDVAWGELAEKVASGAGGGDAPTDPSTSSSSTAVTPSTTNRRYVMLGGKGGVGKTSLSSALAVKYAAAGHTTLVVSTDPAHSLSDSLDVNVAGGAPVRVTGAGADDLDLWGLEVDVAAAKADMRAAAAADGGAQVASFLKSVGLGAFADQLADLRLGELLDTPPPGVDEAVAIAKVVEFVNKDAYAKFDRIVFDTAPTGHTLRLLTLPDFVDATLGKVVRLRQTLTAAADAVKSVFGVKSEVDPAVAAAEALRDRTRAARALFRDKSTTRFVIVTIPTYMAAVESQRLAAALDKEGVPIGAVVVNQVLTDPGGAGAAAFVASRRRDQERALAALEADAGGLASLQVITAPVVDVEVRGVAALRYFGEQAWHKAAVHEGKQEAAE